MKNLSVEDPSKKNGSNIDEKNSPSKSPSTPITEKSNLPKDSFQTPDKDNIPSKSQGNSETKTKEINNEIPTKECISPKFEEKKETMNGSPNRVVNSPSQSKSGHKEINNNKSIEVDPKKCPNVAFYQNKIKSKPNGVFLKEIHEKWWGDYDLLEDDHSYIQWLFPNFYQSDFNINASQLTKEEAEIFRKDKEIARKLVKSYELILDFYGMKLKDHWTGELERTEKYKKRYHDALLTYLHNHLRIRRILTHLNNVGFRKYAIKLVDFLEKEIYGKVGGYTSFMKAYNNTGVKKNEAFESAPLNGLARYRSPFEVWALYGDDKKDLEKIKLLEKNCFSKYPEGFEDSIYFSDIKNEADNCNY